MAQCGITLVDSLGSACAVFLPSHEDGGPGVAAMSDRRITFRIFTSNVYDVVLDSWREVGRGAEDQQSWVGLTAFFQGSCLPGGQGTILAIESSADNSL